MQFIGMFHDFFEIEVGTVFDLQEIERPRLKIKFSGGRKGS